MNSLIGDLQATIPNIKEIDFAPQIIAGTSIGAIVASHPPFNYAARLWELWTELGEANIIQTQFSRYIEFL